MEKLSYILAATKPAAGTKRQAIIGVVASGNLEVLLERDGPSNKCAIEIATAAHGFGPVWEAVLRDFVSLRSAGGLRISINDGGARPDTVALRLAQGVRLIEEKDL
ncbi:malonate decarboxylase acyl carrier protein [Mesorhizobium sp. M0091]|uniref:malonate decarboxylase acyl carrier protein n=1 Tax=Mesorhizobium sp. M0091 TaxID=2956875 RepID=UPI003334F82A